MNWCFIGTGGLAKQVARVILPSGRHRIISVFSRRLESCEGFCKKWGGTACRTPEEAITASGVDAVYIVTPHNSHFQYAKMALELGKPVLLEKPFTVSALETDTLITLARSKRLYLAEAMWTWFSPVAQQVKRWVDGGELGTIHTAKLSYCFRSSRRTGRLFDPNRAGGALLDVGIYPVTYLYRLFGRPGKVECRGTLRGGVDLSEDIAFTFPDGFTAEVRASISSLRGLEHMVLEGDRGSVHSWFFHTASRVRLHRKNGRDEIFRGDGGYLNEFDVVAAEIDAGRTESALVPLDCTSDVMHILDECRRQMGLRYPFEAKDDLEAT